MRRKVILLLILLLISDDVFGKNGNRTKSIKPVHKNFSNGKYKVNNTRLKRSMDDGTEKTFLSSIDDVSPYDNYFDGRLKNIKIKPIVDKDSPFWGTRGRRDSVSDETVPDVQLPISKQHKPNKNLYKLLINLGSKPIKTQLISPSWNNRARHDSDNFEDDDTPEDLFWANRGRRQDDDPFWGTRGRRQEDSPFWANRGRRENVLSNLKPPPWNSRVRYDDDDEPFWGNRGRRQEPEPFWGNRGRRESFEPLWSFRGKQKTKSVYLSKELKNSIVEAINDVKSNIDDLARYRRDDNIQALFWFNRGKDSKTRALFNSIARNRMEYSPNISNKFANNELKSKTFEQNTVHDDRIYAEEPHYILVERSGRSSGEDDPFFITRGKKYGDFEIAKAVRGRRGALEEIVKSVRNDPYYIARGKRDYVKIGNSTTTQGQFLKTRDLVCATIELLMMKYGGDKVKRETIDTDRDRRTILKKLALQLQMDPYFVSRGKKTVEGSINSDTLEKFINKIVVLCN